MKLSLAGYLLLGLIAATLLAGFASYRWATAAQRCKTSMAEAARIAVVRERERAAKADRKATDLFDEVRRTVRGAVDQAVSNTESRGEKIRTVVVTGKCVMPKGLPSLAPAVKEARDAAAD